MDADDLRTVFFAAYTPGLSVPLSSESRRVFEALHAYTWAVALELPSFLYARKLDF